MRFIEQTFDGVVGACRTEFCIDGVSLIAVGYYCLGCIAHGSTVGCRIISYIGRAIMADDVEFHRDYGTGLLVGTCHLLVTLHVHKYVVATCNILVNINWQCTAVHLVKVLALGWVVFVDGASLTVTNIA